MEQGFQNRTWGWYSIMKQLCPWSLQLGAVFNYQLVPHAELIFANNDKGQTRFETLQTPASKWGWGSPTIFRKSALICGEELLRLLLLSTDN